MDFLNLSLYFKLNQCVYLKFRNLFEFLTIIQAEVLKYVFLFLYQSFGMSLRRLFLIFIDQFLSKTDKITQNLVYLLVFLFFLFLVSHPHLSLLSLFFTLKC